MKQFEEIDAAIFTGELLLTDLEEFKGYVERWLRAIKQQEQVNLRPVSVNAIDFLEEIAGHTWGQIDQYLVTKIKKFLEEQS